MSLGKKRSGFQITSVTTDYQPSSPLSPVSPNTSERSPSPSPHNGPRSPPTSRFRLVRLDQVPLGGGRRYQKGRWTCVDFYQLEVGGQLRAGAGHSLDSGLPRAAPTVPPLLLSPGAGTKGQQAPRSQGAPILTGVTEKETTAQLSPLTQPMSPVITVQSDSRPSRPTSDVFNERLLLAQTVFRMGEGTDEDSAPNTGAIDNKIQQAMDLVKTHLLFAVREEVEALKEQIKELSERNSLLEHENTLLRTLSTPQQLSELDTRMKAARKGV